MSSTRAKKTLMPLTPTTSDILIESEGLSKGKAALIGNAIDNAEVEVDINVISKTLAFYNEYEDVIRTMTVPARKQIITDFVVNENEATSKVKSLEIALDH